PGTLRLWPDSILGTEQPERSNSVTISGIRSPRLCFECAWQAGGLRVEGGRQAAAKLAIVSHDQAVGKTALAILPVEKCLLHCSLPRTLVPALLTLRGTDPESFPVAFRSDFGEPIPSRAAREVKRAPFPLRQWRYQPAFAPAESAPRHPQ